MKSFGAAPKTLSTAVVAYAGKSLPELLLSASGGSLPSPSAPADFTVHRRFNEFLISILPADRDAPLPVGFLCSLLRAAILLDSSAASRNDLERRISASLDQAAIGDLMTLSFDYSGQRLTDLGSVRRIVIGFAELEIVGAAAQRVARIVDAFLAEIATEEDLPVSMFAGIAGALPKSARRLDDDLYRAVDIYLKVRGALEARRDREGESMQHDRPIQTLLRCSPPCVTKQASASSSSSPSTLLRSAQTPQRRQHPRRGVDLLGLERERPAGRRRPSQRERVPAPRAGADEALHDRHAEGPRRPREGADGGSSAAPDCRKEADVLLNGVENAGEAQSLPAWFEGHDEYQGEGGCGRGEAEEEEVLSILRTIISCWFNS
ncbi:Root phototropism protein 2 [Platanthera guangdongensis]|uniref:Root phototropism protein 2 n=1 Tax=Platanthera guangdongensis TaxID=2320717 RepID=A0ABR2LUH5_9ASPA